VNLEVAEKQRFPGSLSSSTGKDRRGEAHEPRADWTELKRLAPTSLFYIEPGLPPTLIDNGMSPSGVRKGPARDRKARSALIVTNGALPQIRKVSGNHQGPTRVRKPICPNRDIEETIRETASVDPVRFGRFCSWFALIRLSKPPTPQET
jgi:hypothetical protein